MTPLVGAEAVGHPKPVEQSNDVSLPTATPLEIRGEREALTHYLFRYPAKFHPPVVRTLLEDFTRKHEIVLDPFCGSGTALVEAATCGRNGIGRDVDPLAVLVAQVKVRRYQMPSLRESGQLVLNRLKPLRRPDEEYERRKFPKADLTDAEYEEQIRPVRYLVPAIPNLLHWFRKYVIVDLARVCQAIENVAIPETQRDFLRVVFASIIRNASNADPVPVSGLEVTSHMLKLDEKGRLVNPFAFFERAVEKALDAAEAFSKKADRSVTSQVSCGDATQLSRHLRRTVDAVLTSPPYHGAVDYYRRHQLEMFWLAQTCTVQERRQLLRSYIGRPKVPASHPFVAEGVLKTSLAKEWEQKIRDVSEERANAFLHYMVAMTRFFEGLAAQLRPQRPALLVVGHSSWNASQIPTTELFAELAGDDFRLTEVLSYPVKNRYMSYARHNDADINTEYVLVFRRRKT